MAIIVPLIVLLTISTGHAKTEVPNFYTEKVCLAKAIYHESRGEPDSGKKAVAKVVLNRKEHKEFPKSICKVINQVSYVGKRKICQFSWNCGKQRIDTKSDSWEDSLSLSHAILSNSVSLPKFGSDVLFFKSKYCRQSFGKGFKLVAVIGNAKFYQKMT